MKHYVVVASSEEERSKIEETIARIGLKEKLVIRHKQDLPDCCPVEVHCEVRDGTKYTNVRNTGLKMGLLVLVKDATDPQVSVSDSKYFYIDSPAEKLGLMMIIFEDVAVYVLFKGSTAWGIDNS